MSRKIVLCFFYSSNISRISDIFSYALQLRHFVLLVSPLEDKPLCLRTRLMIFENKEWAHLFYFIISWLLSMGIFPNSYAMNYGNYSLPIDSFISLKYNNIRDGGGGMVFILIMIPPYKSNIQLIFFFLKYFNSIIIVYLWSVISRKL